MSTTINWESTTDSLTGIHRSLTGRPPDWPSPNIEAAPITDEQRRRARLDWADRTRATYVSAEHATALSHQFFILGAPMDLVVGASYAARELTHHLSMVIHLLKPLHGESTLRVPDTHFVGFQGSVSWSSTVTHALDLFTFNLGLSEPIYDALSVVTSDPAIAELCETLKNSLRELNRLGQEVLTWMGRKLPASELITARAYLPYMLRAYEALCHGGPDVLDRLAGDEIAVEARPGNLATLQRDHLAAIFYDRLSAEIFPSIEALGWQGLTAWRENPSPPEQSLSAGITALGLSSRRTPNHHKSAV